MKRFLVMLTAVAAALVIFAGVAAAETTFAVSDYNTGNPYFSADLSVDPVEAPNGRVAVNFLPDIKEGFDFAGYQITETAVEPTTWEALIPTGYVFDATPAEGVVTLYAWVKYTDPEAVEPDIVEMSSDWVVYSTNVPTITVDEVNTYAGAYEMQIQWETDASAIGWVEYRVADSGDEYQASAPTEFAEWHTVNITGILDETDYDIVIHSNTSTLSYPMTTTTPQPVETDVVWKGGALNPDETPDLSWSRGRNWEGGYPPANPTPGAVIFMSEGASMVDADGGTWTVGSVIRRVSETDDQGTHTIDLADNTLIVTNELWQNHPLKAASTSSTELAITNGTLQMGTAAAPAHIKLTGSLSNNAGTKLTLNDTVVLDAVNLGDILISVPSQGGTSTVLDLQGVKLPSEAANVLYAQRILMEQGGFPTRGGYCAIRLDDASDIDTLAVSERFTVAGSDSDGSVIARIGIPDGNPASDPYVAWTLPEGMTVIAGNKVTDQRGNFHVASPRNNTGGRNGMVVFDGGTFDAYVEECYIAGYSGGGGTSNGWPSPGIFDARTVTSFELDAVDMRIGRATTKRPNVQGYAYLPAGTAKVSSLMVGFPHDMTTGYLELNGTDFEITNVLSLERGGEILVNVGAEASGLTLPEHIGNIPENDPFMPVFADDGIIRIHFAEAPAGTGIHYGLRWKGDKMTELAELNLQNRIVWTADPSIVGPVPAIVQDAEYTYVALTEAALPPVAVAGDVTAVLLNGSTTVTALQVNNGSSDPGELEMTFKLSMDEIEDVDELTFTELGDYEVTLTVTNTENMSSTATAMVHVIDEATWRGIELWWSGADPNGDEWSRSANWIYNGRELFMPVPNPSTGSFIFPVAGNSIVDPQEGTTWTVASLIRDVNTYESTGDHMVDLGGNTLAVTNLLQQRHRTSLSGQTQMVLSNGTLELGTLEQPATISMIGGLSESSSSSTRLKLADTIVLNPVNIEEIFFELGVSYGNVVLDLQGVQLVPEAAGTLKVNELLMERGGFPSRGGYCGIQLDELTGIDTLIVSNTLTIAGSNESDSVIARIGIPGPDPEGVWTLPEGMSVIVGDRVAEQRGNLNIASPRTDPGGRDGMLVLNGGSFDAYVDQLLVAGLTAGGGTATGWDGPGVLDVSTATSFAIDALDMRIGIAQTNKPNAQGYVYLPQGTATVGSLHIGFPHEMTTGYLELNGTDFQIADWLTIQQGGELAVNVGTTACGLDLPDGTWAFDEILQEDVFTPFPLTFEDNGVITVNFDEVPASGARHYGMRWKGAVENTKDVLDQLALDGHLAVTISEDITAYDANAYWEVEHDGEYAYVSLKFAAPDYSAYAFEIETPSRATVGADTLVPVTLANEPPAGSIPYAAVLCSFDAAGPGDVSFTSGEYTAVNSGTYPDEAFELPVVYNSASDWTLNFSECGEYAITFRCYEVGDEENPIAEQTVFVNAYILGDADGSGSVDLLDLVFVRNRLFMAAEGESAAADVDGSGIVDLDDVIIVRNNLGAECGQAE